MTGWIIFLSVVVIVTVGFALFEKKNRYSDSISIFLMGFAGFLFALLPTALIMVLLTFSTPNTTEVETKELQALSAGSSVEGNYFLLAGYVEGELTFNYFEGNPVDGVTYKSVDADTTTVYESTSTPRIEFYYEVNNSPFAINGPWKWLDHVHIYIPEGSIKNDYTISP